MLKPHIWVKEDGWAGDLSYKTETDWKKWEESYRNYVLFYAKIAEENKVEMFCMGTEIRKSVVQRKAFWFSLIQEIRIIYNGKLTMQLIGTIIKMCLFGRSSIILVWMPTSP